MTITTQRFENAESHGIESPRLKPVKWWAAIGCLSLALIVYSWGRWLLGGHTHATSTGADPVPMFMTISARVQEAVFFGAALLMAYFVIVKPWRRERQLTFDGRLLIALVTVFMLQDPLLNYGRVIFTYNAALLDLGCPQCYLPGWQSFGQTLAEPMLWGLGAYAGMIMLVVFAGCRIMRWFHGRWPQFGRLGPSVFMLGSFVIFDLLTEIGWIRLGLYSYVNVPEQVTLFDGHYYQFPLIALIFGGIYYMVPSTMRYFRNDRGESWAERGIEQVKATPKQRNALRLLAVIGMTNVGLFLLFNLPMAFVATQSNNWSKDTLDRSYLRNEMCGDGTKYACYDPRVPLRSGPDSAYITPDGKLVTPKGLPVQTSQ